MEAARTMPNMFLGPTRLSANWVAPTLVAVSTLTYYVCWKISERARARRMAKGGRAGSSSLPSPPALLPRWLPFLGGHTLQMDFDKLNQQLEGYADEFGGDYEQTIMGRRVVYVTGEEDIRRILLQRPSKFKRGMWPGQLSSLAAKVGMEPSLFFNEGKQWGRSRRTISPALSGHHNVANMIPAIAKIAHRLCSKLNDQDGKVVEFVQTFEYYTHDVIALVAFGFDADSVRATEDRPSVSFDAMHSVVSALMKLSFDPLSMLGWTMMPALLPWVRDTKTNTRRLHRVVEGSIDSMRRQINEGVELRPENGGELLRKLISVQGSSDGATKSLDNRMKYSDEEILPEVMGMFLAGSETTARALCWAMYYLAKHPEMHARCREEALQVAPTSGGVVSTAEQLSQLVFCSAVFKESTRLWPAAPLLFMYSTEATTMENGMEFEAGTAYTLLVGHPSLSEDSFTKAKDFVPERWIEAEREEALGGGGSVGGDVVHREEAAFFFGAGPRRCPGENVATLEASIILAAICARFDLALAPGQVDPPDSVMTVTAGPRSLELVVTRKSS